MSSRCRMCLMANMAGNNMLASVLIVTLTCCSIFTVVGCKSKSQDPKPMELGEIKRSLSDLNGKIEGLEKSVRLLSEARQAHLNDSAIKAVASANEKLDQKDYVGTYDLLLAAIRLDPSSPEVFAATLGFVRQTLQSDDDLALDLANDLYVRVAGLIPFQPLSDISSAREEYQKTGDIFEPTAPYVPPDPLEYLRDRITHLGKSDLPGEVASLLVQAIRSELESLAIAINDEPTSSTDDFWQEWQELDNELKKVETKVLTTLYAASDKRKSQWHNESVATIKRYNKTTTKGDPTEFVTILGDIDAQIQAGFRLRLEIAPFAEAGIVAAKNHQRDVDKRLNFLERTGEWIYNQHALATITSVREGPPIPAMDKLKRLARHDERRLSPYVQMRFHEQWNRWFEELDTEKQKETATRLRILRDAK